MTAALTGAALSEGGAVEIAPELVGPASPYPRLADVRTIRPETTDADTDQFPVVEDVEPDITENTETEVAEVAEVADLPDPAPEPVTTSAPAPAPQPEPAPEPAPTPAPVAAPPAPVLEPESVSPAQPGRATRTGQWVSARWNMAIGSAASAAFVTGLFGSGLGQLSYWVTKFPFWLAIMFALTFELAMVGITRRVRLRKIAELPAGAMHAIGWMAAIGAAGWNLIHLSDPGVVVAFDAINGGEPLFRGGPVVGASFATIAMLGFLIHEQSEKYHVEDALASKGKKIQRIGVARVLNYPRVAWEVWRNRVADPSIDIDAEFLRVLSAKRGKKALAEVEAKAHAPVQEEIKSSGNTRSADSVQTRSEADLNKLVHALLTADEEAGRLGFRKVQTKFGLTQADARKLRAKADETAQKHQPA